MADDDTESFNTYLLEDNLLVIQLKDAVLSCEKKAISLDHAIKMISEGTDIIIDLSQVTYLDECVPGHLLEAFLKARKQESFLAVAGMPKPGKQWDNYWRLHASGASKIIQTYSDVNAAAKAYKNNFRKTTA